MAKKDAKKAEGETTSAEGATPAPAPKPEKVYFLGEKFAAANSVFGNIKAIIAANQDIPNGKGVATSFIVKEMLEKYQPKKSANYGEKYVRAYVRDLEKFGYATCDASKAVAVLTTPPEKEKKEGKKPGKLSETGTKILEVLKNKISEEDKAAGKSSVTAEVLATELGMKPMAVGKAVESLMKNEYVSMKEEGETITLHFTPKGAEAAASL